MGCERHFDKIDVDNQITVACHESLRICGLYRRRFQMIVISLLYYLRFLFCFDLKRFYLHFYHTLFLNHIADSFTFLNLPI